MKHDELALRIAERLRKTLPGEDAQYAMAPHYRTKGSFSKIDPSSYQHSAVMALICRRDRGHYFIPLTLRAEYAGPHSAQVSLPGGRYDEMDGTLANTALRECYEEIGIRENVEILGRLSTLHIPVSRFIVHPFVAVYHSDTVNYQSHEREVKAVLEADIAALLDDKNLSSATFRAESGSVEAPCFSISGHNVWGATAMILSELRQVIKETHQAFR